MNSNESLGEATNDEFKAREEHAKQIYEQNVSKLGQRNAPTLAQVRFALKLNLDPIGKFRQEISDLISDKLEGQEQERLTRQMRAYLRTLYPEDMRTEVEQMEHSVLQQEITTREDELIEQFPVGSYIHFDEKNGVISGYFKKNLSFASRFFGLKKEKGSKGKGSTYSLKYLLNAKKAEGFVDTQVAAMPALEERIADRIKILLSQVEFIDLSTAMKQTNYAVTQLIRKKARSGTLNPETITDDEVDTMIGNFKGKTY